MSDLWPFFPWNSDLCQLSALKGYQTLNFLSTGNEQGKENDFNAEEMLSSSKSAKLKKYQTWFQM